jgi:DNA invertase Pin-like site-specific DNA recombinase
MNPRTMWDGGMEAQTEDKPNQRADILRMVNSGKTSAAEAARLFGLHRSSVSRLISQANAGISPVG